jgi:SNF family Na+-dependent transporter
MTNNGTSSHESWGTRIGLVLAMAGNAIGLGNFLRFPRQAAANGGGSFMVPYFIALLLLGIPLMWIEWGIGRHGGRYRKGHMPGMFTVLWRHPLAKYLGVIGLAIPLFILIYYTYIMAWTAGFTVSSLTKDYWGLATQEQMVAYLHSFQGVGGSPYHAPWTPYLYFTGTFALVLWIVSKGVSGGIERLARIAMPILFVFGVVLAVAVLNLPAGPGGETAWDGLEFIYRPDLSLLGSPTLWLAAAGQIFFTLSLGQGTLHAYASYLSKEDDIALNGLATAATNESAEVVLGGTIAIPAAVTFFGVTGAVAIANGGSYNLGFATMPVVFQQLPLGNLLGTMWFGLLFIAGLTTAVALITPAVAFLREEFGVSRARVVWTLGGVCFLFGLMHVTWLGRGVLDEWDYWAGTFGLVVFAIIEVILFLWVFGPDKAWREIHEGADIRIPRVFKHVMTWVTPLYLAVILVWWGKDDALPIILNRKSAGSSAPVVPADEPYIWGARLAMVAIALVLAVLVHRAWRRNGYDSRKGFVEGTGAAVPTGGSR